MRRADGHDLASLVRRAAAALVVAVFLIAGCAAGDPGSTEPQGSGPSPTTRSSGEENQQDHGGAESSPTAANSGKTSSGFSLEQLLRGMNTALRDQDREAFFGYVAAEAEQDVALWWDNMEALGMSSGGISVASGDLTELEPGSSEQATVRLGALTAGTPQAQADGPYFTSGEYLVGSSTYDVTISVDDSGRSQISSFVPAGVATPWDAGPLTAVTTDHVLVAGLASEDELVQRVADQTAEPAQWVLDQYREGLGHAPIERFTLFVTSAADRVSTWFQTGSVNSELAGFTVPQRRLGPAPGLDERIATDTASPWGQSVVTVGPQGLESAEALQSLTAHEFTHAVNFARLPVPEDRSRVISEGWAEYQQELWDSGFFSPEGSWRATQLRSCLDGGSGYPTDADFDVDGRQIYCGYVLSASVYAFAADQGVDVFALSTRARSTGEDPIEASAHLDTPELTKDGWSEWVHAQFG